MKKVLAILVVVAVIAGCNKEKIYKENLEGIWQVYKYLLYNTDKTQSFQNMYPNYTITFTKDGKFTEFFTAPDTAYVDGTYSFADNDEKLVLNHKYYTYVTDTNWIDTVNFTIDTIPVEHPVKREFTIFNLTRDHVQLRTDTSQYYMNKKTTP